MAIAHPNAVFYQAFGSNRELYSNTRLHIHFYMPEYRRIMPRYDLLYNVIGNDTCTYLVLVFNNHVVKIHGRLLWPLEEALLDHSVIFIEEYNPEMKDFDPAVDPLNEPCIDKIEVEGIPDSFFN